MCIRLSDTVFTFGNHVKWGVPVETPVDPPCGVPPSESLGLTHPAWTWPVDNRKCHGLSRVSFSFNGLDRQAWICTSFLDHDKIWSHGDAYARIVNGAWSTLNGEPKIDLSWGRKSYVPRNIYEFEEQVMEWGYGSEMSNTIPASRFIKLLRMGRGVSDSDWAEYSTILLNSIGIEPTDNPVQKASATFSKTKHVGELLKVIANEKTYDYKKQAQPCSQWSQRTKSTSTIY
jgi:hypothetical protein